MQSAYRERHSTETALLRVHHDIALALDNNSCAALVMLDLSAAFDVIDHNILHHRLEYSYGITGSALTWIMSYLHDRYQNIIIGNTLSKDFKLNYGVPQGSVLGPKIYTMFAKPIGSLCRQHGLSYHSYADDTQVYLVFKPTTPWRDTADQLEACLRDISAWMSANMLKLNQDKTELIVFRPKNRVNDHSVFTLDICGTIIHDVSSVKNLGVHFDRALDMQKQVGTTAKACSAQIRAIGRIRPYITTEACKSLVCSLVTSRLDYGNALLYGINGSVLSRLQRVQNMAARLVTRKRKYDHITAILMSLHWLPVKFRIMFKILLYVFKIMQGTAPAYLSDVVSEYRPARCLRSEYAAQIRAPRIRTKTYGERRFDWVAATLWNGLPGCFLREHSEIAFRRLLKTHFFRLAFND